MRQLKIGLILAAIGTTLLVGCGGGGGSSSGSSSSGGGANVAPVANAGTAQTVSSGVSVTLNGGGSTDSDGSVAGYTWAQTAGTAVTLSSTTATQPTFEAPTVATSTTLTFSLVVTDNRASASAPSTVNITVNPASGYSNVSGRVRFARVNFNTASPRGLNYANPVLRPARALVVRALDATTQEELTQTRTDESGDFSMMVAANTRITVVVEARMASLGAPPTWDVRVQDGILGTNPYQYSHGPFNSSSGTARAINIPTGVNAAGEETGTRSSAPFAILDTIYTAMKGVLEVEPTANFPPFIVDWGAQFAGTFYSSGGVNIQHIALLSDLTEDTDEFDQHVIAHEFGHYIEYNFSRADNIGGSHGLGDRLDPRVAFGEGFGYAFAAMMLNDPMARDSFVQDITPDDGMDNPVSVSGGFSVETNPVTNPPAPSGDSTGCWCSESSAFSILWDLFDSAADTNDSVSMGFAPLWQVLVDDQKTTPAYTTIFSFISALKQKRPSEVTAINALLTAQNIDVAVEPFAGGEGHVPTSGLPGNAVVLPVYTTVMRGGGPLTLQTSGAKPDTLYNKLGNRRFVRYVHDGATASFTISLSSTGPDPDFQVRRPNGSRLFADLPPAETEVLTVANAIAGTYLIEAYDCANGCSGDNNGTPGNYTLTLTVN